MKTEHSQPHSHAVFYGSSVITEEATVLQLLLQKTWPISFRPYHELYTSRILAGKEYIFLLGHSHNSLRI